MDRKGQKLTKKDRKRQTQPYTDINRHKRT